jgi:tRNA G18 (ribose-2'-O)-methylase SpoU
MGSVFARPPARAGLAELEGFKLVLEGSAGPVLREVDLGTPLILCLGAEREGLPADVAAGADATARISMRPDAPDSLNVANAAAVGLYEVANRMADRA